MKCKNVKQIKHDDDKDCVEASWARESLTIEPSRVNVIKGRIGFRMYEWNTFGHIDL